MQTLGSDYSPFLNDVFDALPATNIGVVGYKNIDVYQHRLIYAY